MKPIHFAILLPTAAFACASLTGCAGFQQLDEVTDAVRAGKVSGLPASTNYIVGGSMMSFSAPDLPAGPYTKIGSMEVQVLDGVANKGSYVFFCGKSDETRQWEIFSCMKWETNAWKLVPVTLDRPSLP